MLSIPKHYKSDPKLKQNKPAFINRKKHIQPSIKMTHIENTDYVYRKTIRENSWTND